jgi:ADP-heptose:LPS heptosyltransferase
MITKLDIVQMAFNSETKVYDLDYYRTRVRFLDDYQPTKPVTQGKLKTDRERVKEIQKRTNFKDLRK